MNLSMPSTPSTSTLRLALAAGLGAFALGLPARAESHVSVDLHFGVPAPVVVHEAPPRPVREIVVTSPGRGYVWVPGHYVWHHHRYTWVSGAWVLPPQPAAIYVDGRWDPVTRNWIEAHWELPPPPLPAPVYVVQAPPPPRTEVIIARPSPQHVWVCGYWVWRGHRHEWVAGHWELPPRGVQVWVAPRWEHRPNGYVFVEGCWR